MELCIFPKKLLCYPIRYRFVSDYVCTRDVVNGLISLDYTFIVGSVLDGNEEAANLLADEVHHDVAMATEPALGGVDLQIPLEDVGVWIDPIGKLTHLTSDLSKLSNEINA